MGVEYKTVLIQARQGRRTYLCKHGGIPERKAFDRLSLDTCESGDFRPQTASSDFQDGVELA